MIDEIIIKKGMDTVEKNLSIWLKRENLEPQGPWRVQGAIAWAVDGWLIVLRDIEEKTNCCLDFVPFKRKFHSELFSITLRMIENKFIELGWISKPFTEDWRIFLSKTKEYTSNIAALRKKSIVPDFETYANKEREKIKSSGLRDILFSSPEKAEKIIKINYTNIVAEAKYAQRELDFLLEQKRLTGEIAAQRYFKHIGLSNINGNESGPSLQTNGQEDSDVEAINDQRPHYSTIQEPDKRKMIELWNEGWDRQEIARRVGYAPGTVTKEISNLRKKYSGILTKQEKTLSGIRRMSTFSNIR